MLQNNSLWFFHPLGYPCQEAGYKLAKMTLQTSHLPDRLLREAITEAKLGLKEGGLPIGSVLADRSGHVIARGHNLRVQAGDPTAHAEVACIRNAGRRRDWHELILVSTLSPCIMCTGTSLLFRIPIVVIGENQNFLGAEELFREAGVEVIVMNDVECVEMMERFITEHPDLWKEDIGVPEQSRRW